DGGERSHQPYRDAGAGTGAWSRQYGRGVAAAKGLGGCRRHQAGRGRNQGRDGQTKYDMRTGGAFQPATFGSGTRHFRRVQSGEGSMEMRETPDIAAESS